MKITTLCAGILAGMLAPAAGVADEFLAMPGLWKTTYEVEGNVNAARGPIADGAAPAAGAHAAQSTAGTTGPKFTWRCVAEDSDPWASFAQLHDLPGMTCTRTSLEFKSTSLKWKTECRGPGPTENADVVRSEGTIVFDSPQHYTGSVTLTGTLMGYPLQTTTKVSGERRAACTSPAD